MASIFSIVPAGASGKRLAPPTARRYPSLPGAAPLQQRQQHLGDR